MSRSRLLVFGIALAIAGVLVRRYLEQQEIEPVVETQTPPPTGGAQPNAGAGAPGNPDPASLSRADLYAEAQRLGVKGRSTMSKAELAAAVAAARRAQD